MKFYMKVDVNKLLLDKAIGLEKKYINSQLEVENLKKSIANLEEKIIDNEELMRNFFNLQEYFEDFLDSRKIGSVNYIQNTKEYKIGSLFFESLNSIKRLIKFNDELNLILSRSDILNFSKKEMFSYSDASEGMWSLRHKRMMAGEVLVKFKRNDINGFKLLIKLFSICLL